MKLSKELLRSESAHSGLMFRERAYTPEEDAELLRDLLGLANADAADPRWLIIGVGDRAGGPRSFPGVDRHTLIDFKQRVLALAARAIEPELELRITGANFDGAILAIVALTGCTERPYLVREPVGHLMPGTGFVRRGSQASPLRRADLQAMLGLGPGSKAVDNGSTSAASAEVGADTDDADEDGLRVFFAARDEPVELVLPVLPLEELPSALAARRIRALLEAKQASRKALGRTETRLQRLMHARMYGADTPFEERSDETLSAQLANVVEDYSGADDHYRFETRAHKMQVAVKNQASSHLKEAILELEMHLIDGTGVSGNLHNPDGTVSSSEAYPIIVYSGHTVIIRREFDVLPARGVLRAFPEPPRLWAREAAAGKTMTVDYRVEAPWLDEPVAGELSIRFTAAAAARRR